MRTLLRAGPARPVRITIPPPTPEQRHTVGHLAAATADPEGPPERHAAFAQVVIKETASWHDMALLWNEMTACEEWPNAFQKAAADRDALPQ